MKTNIKRIVSLMAICGTITAEAVKPNDYVTIPWRSAPHEPLVSTKWNGTIQSTGRPYTAYKGVL